MPETRPFVTPEQCQPPRQRRSVWLLSTCLPSPCNGRSLVMRAAVLLDLQTRPRSTHARSTYSCRVSHSIATPQLVEYTGMRWPMIEGGEVELRSRTVSRRRMRPAKSQRDYHRNLCRWNLTAGSPLLSVGRNQSNRPTRATRIDQYARGPSILSRFFNDRSSLMLIKVGSGALTGRNTPSKHEEDRKSLRRISGRDASE